MLRLKTYHNINERLAEINLPELDLKTIIKKYRTDIMQQLDDNIDEFVQKEIEGVFASVGYEVLDSSSHGFEQFYYNFKVRKHALIYAVNVGKELVRIAEGTEDLQHDKEDFKMYIHGYRLGTFETIQKALKSADEYEQMRQADAAKGEYRILWTIDNNNLVYHEKEIDYIGQTVPIELLKLKNREALEQAMLQFATEQKNKDLCVPTIYLNGKRFFFIKDRELRSS